MIEIQTLRNSPQFVIDRLKIKHFDATDIVEQIQKLDQNRRQLIKQLDDNLAEANGLSREIGILYKDGKVSEAGVLKEKTALLKQQSKSLQDAIDGISPQLDELLVLLPNLPNESVPPGKTSEDNQVVLQEGDIPVLDADAVPHWDLVSRYDLVSFELGNKITGSGFPVYKGRGARLQRALISCFLDQAIEAGYTEYLPPLMVNAASAFGTGQLPDKDGQMYYMPEDQLYMIPTAEVPVTNFFRDTILEEKELPVKCVAYSACFRREAGSYGKDVRGLNRLHQFDKVEIVQVVEPEKSYEVLNEMASHVAGLLRKLQLPFRMLKLCGGDMGFASALTYDMEVYSAAQKRWLEVSSVSNFESFQSNRMKLRYRNAAGKNILAHTLNGSALALPRILAALLENNQTSSGILIPEVLRPYTGFSIID